MTTPIWTEEVKHTASWNLETKPVSPAIWSDEQKNMVRANVLFNQAGIPFNKLGVQFGGIMRLTWTLVDKNT